LAKSLIDGKMRVDFGEGAEMRKGLVYGVVIAACAAWFGVVDATYVIKLKNGNEYVTTRYWHDGSQVLFDTYGGIFGIEKRFVVKIEKTEQVVKLVTVSDRDPSERTQTDSKKGSDEQGKETQQEATPKKEKAADDPIVGELNRLKEKSQEVGGMLTGEIRELLSQITAFKNKLVKDSKLFIEYGREFNDLNETADTVEAALRSRTQ
jgi:hypothetical protein